MKLPKGHFQRESFFQQIILDAFSSRPSRVAVYDVWKNYFYYGTSAETQPVEYNKLAAHIDLLASFLFSGETTSFVVEDDEDAEGEPDFELSKCAKISPAITKLWHRCNMDILFNEAVIWALVYQTMFIKLVPDEKNICTPHVLEPHAVGVLLENEPMLDRQPCIVHEFYITKSDLERRIKTLPESDQKLILAMCGPVQPAATGTTAPITGTDRLIIAATDPNVVGAIKNPTAVVYDFNPEINEDVVVAQEIWIWDEEYNDYCTALMLDGFYLLVEQKNTFLPKEHPFIKVCPNSLYNYFWGMSELVRLSPLQDWVNERMPEIKLHLQKQTNPPRSASGFSGYADEKAFGILSNPGATVFEPSPQGAKLEQHLPAPINVFEVLDRIDMLYAEASGIRELMQGKGESGVRARSHADLLVRVGSSRVKKKAAILEDAVEKIGYLLFCMMKRYDDTHYKTDKGTEFTAKQISDKAIVKVDSHSSSPIFIEQQIDKAQMLFDRGVIDGEDLIDSLKPQNPALLKRKFRKREAAKAAAAAAEAQAKAKEEADKAQGKGGPQK